LSDWEYGGFEVQTLFPVVYPPPGDLTPLAEPCPIRVSPGRLLPIYAGPLHLEIGLLCRTHALPARVPCLSAPFDSCWICAGAFIPSRIELIHRTSSPASPPPRCLTSPSIRQVKPPHSVESSIPGPVLLPLFSGPATAHTSISSKAARPIPVPADYL
jgi:hypothetical protein